MYDNPLPTFHISNWSEKPTHIFLLQFCINNRIEELLYQFYSHTMSQTDGSRGKVSKAHLDTYWRWAEQSQAWALLRKRSKQSLANAYKNRYQGTPQQRTTASPELPSQFDHIAGIAEHCSIWWTTRFRFLIRHFFSARWDLNRRSLPLKYVRELTMTDRLSIVLVKKWPMSIPGIRIFE